MPAAPAELGTLPTDVDVLMPGLGYGPARLTCGTSPDGSSGTEQDVFFLDGSSAQSLQRLTDTDGKDEAPVLLF